MRERRNSCISGGAERASNGSQDFGLRLPHARLILGGGVVVSQQVQHAVDGQQLQFVFYRVAAALSLSAGARVGNGDIAQVGASAFGVGFSCGEGEYIGGGVYPQVVPVEGLKCGVIGDAQAQGGIGRLPLVGQRGLYGLLYGLQGLRGDGDVCLQVGHGEGSACSGAAAAEALSAVRAGGFSFRVG